MEIFIKNCQRPGAQGSCGMAPKAFGGFFEASASCGIVLAKMKKAAAMAVFSAALKDPARVSQASAKTHPGSGSFQAIPARRELRRNLACFLDFS